MLYEKKLSRIQALLLDVDGVMTDARVFLDSDGQWRRFFSIRDGYGIRMLLEQGYLVGVITASKASDIAERVKVLEIPYFYDNSFHKKPAFDDFLGKTGLKPEQVAYMGDDLFDLPVLQAVGFSATVSDAMEEVLEAVDYIAKRPAGNGAVREVCDLIRKFGAKSV
jgi:3-deoxy-D-manno-octulosonate 8-phosphate phosphatase (KDO 8-P phosphatase)